jgi:cytochrome oxidase Cu insertion factor (SCO1/SenC/PrrC family)
VCSSDLNKLSKLYRELQIHERDEFMVPPITIPGPQEWKDLVAKERAKEALGAQPAD